MNVNKIYVGNHKFEWGTRTYVMGILNITPDSFSGDGLMPSGSLESLIPMVLERAGQFLSDGADILDVGGESTRPGAQPVSEMEEYNRVIPVIQALAEEFDAVISIDTYRSRVAQAGLDAGALMVNDIWGLHADQDMAKVIASNKAPVILMHNRSSWANAEIKEKLGGRYVGVAYENLLQDVKQDLLDSVDMALEQGVSKEQIILDPGIGFGKTVEQNLELLNRIEEIRSMGYPILVGPSRKSFIGYTLDLPPHQRLEGTAAAVAVSIARGADIIRVHDVAFMSRVARMTDAIVRANQIEA